MIKLWLRKNRTYWSAHWRATSRQCIRSVKKIYDECNSSWHQPDEVFQEAFKWLQKAADGGEMRAYTTLGYMYASGKGVESNPMKALNCFKKAADAGDDNAAFMVGFMKKQMK